MATTLEKSPVDKRFDWLTSAMKKVGGNEAQQRVANHLRSVTNGKHFLLANYHNDSSITDEVKTALYQEIWQALIANSGKPDWTRLKGGVGQGAKRVDPIEVQPPAPVAKPAAATPTVPVVTDEPEFEPKPVAVKPRKPDADAGNAGDKLRDALAELLGGRVQAEVSVDENAVEAIAGRVADVALTNYDNGLADRIKKHLGNGSFPVERVQKLIDDAMANNVRSIVLVAPSGETKKIAGLVHRQFEVILKMTSSRVTSGHPVPLWLDGPPGGGKSHLMEQVAEALGLQPYILAIGPTDTKSAIVGSVATGEFRPGIAYEPYKNGGVLGIDEIAAGDPGVLVSINSLVANQSYRFPNGEMVKKHKDFHVIAADNTRGHGNVKGMIRNRLDAATLDRFAFIKVAYDEQLEAALCGNASWAAYVKKVRDYVASNSAESVYITPRASINGAALLAGGIEVADVVESTLFRFLSPDLKNTIATNVGTYKP